MTVELQNDFTYAVGTGRDQDLHCTVSGSLTTGGTVYNVLVDKCEYTAGTPHLIALTLPEQLQLINTNTDAYTIRIYRRLTDNYGSWLTNGITLPTVPDEIKVHNMYVHTLTEGFKVYVDNTKICPLKFQDFTVVPAHKTANEFNYFEIDFRTFNTDTTATSVMEIDFMTNNELDLRFAGDLGQTLEPLQTEVEIDCDAPSGLTGVTQTALSCKFNIVDTDASTNPVTLKVTGIDSAFGTSALSKFRMVNIKNPEKRYADILSVDLMTHMTMRIYNNDEVNRYEIYRSTDYRIYGGAECMATDTINAGQSCAITTGMNNLAASIDPNPLTTYTTISSYLEFTFETAIADIGNSSLILVLDEAFSFQNNGELALSCTIPSGTSCSARQYKNSLWVIMDVAHTGALTGAQSIRLTSNGDLFKSPHYTKTSYPLTLMIFDNDEYKETHTANLSGIDASTPTFAISNLYTILNRNTYDHYQLTITPTRQSDMLERVDIHFPSTYQWTNSTCTSITGLDNKLVTDNIYPVSCISDCSAETCSGIVSITNFRDVDLTDNIVVDISAMSPTVAGVTPAFQVYLYASETDTTRKIEEHLTETLTIETQSYPYDIWMNFPTSDMYERELRAGSIGEMTIRLETRVSIPIGGRIDVVLPDDFDIAIGGNIQCKVGHTDMPFDNFPLIWDPGYDHTIVTDCVWTEHNVVNIHFPDANILREFYGVTNSICTYITLTTTDATAGLNGIEAPQNPGWYDVELNTFDADKLPLGRSFSQVYIDPIDVPAAGFDITMNGVGISENSVTIVTFTPLITIPRTYAYTIDNVSQPTGGIRVTFKALEGWSADLGDGYATGDSVPCQAISGIVGTNSGDIQCTITIGLNLNHAGTNTDVYPTDSYITITNFEEIAANTAVEFHFPKIKNPAQATWIPEIGLGVYETSPAGQVTWLYYTTWKTLSTAQAVLPPTVQTAIADNDITLSDPMLDQLSTWTIALNNFQGLNTNDYLIITLPSTFDNMARQTDLTIGIGAETLIPYQIYSDEKIIAVKSDANIGAANVVLTLTNFRNPGYIDDQNTHTMTIETYLTDGGGLTRLTDSWTSASSLYAANVASATGFTTASLANVFIDTTDTKANAVNQGISASFASVAQIPTGSVLRLTLPQAYPRMTDSSPVPICSSNITGATCTVNGGYVEITGYSTVAARTQITVDITGVKNPAVGTNTLTGATGFIVQAWDNALTQNLIINEQVDANYDRIDAADALAIASLIIETRFVTAGVRTNYTLTINIARVMFVDSTIKILWPSGYVLTSDLSFEIDSNVVQYSSWTASGNSFEMVTSTELASNKIFEITFFKIDVPTHSSDTSQTYSPFTIEGWYDGLQVAETLSPGSVDLGKAPESLYIKNIDFYPQNEGEYATYTFDVEFRVDVAKNSNTKLMFVFPDEYGSELVPVTKRLICTSSPRTATDCYVSEPREVHFDVFIESVTPQQVVPITIFGISNPTAGFPSTLYTYLINTDSKEVLAYLESNRWEIQETPKILNMTYVDVDSTHVNSDANYQFGFKTILDAVNADDKIYIDWPDEYYGNFFFSEYTCNLESDTPTGDLSCIMDQLSGAQRTEISGFSAIPAASDEVKIKIDDVPTLSSVGESPVYDLRTYDTENKVVMERSYPQTTTVRSVSFSNEDYSILIARNLVVTVTKLTYSDPFDVKLSVPPYDSLILTPASAEPNLTFMPNKLDFQWNWGTANSMRIGADFEVAIGRYRVLWSKSEDDSTYSELKDIYVEVVEPAGDIEVTVDPIPELHVGATSAEVFITLGRYPADKVHILLSTDDEHASKLTFNPTTVEFNDQEITKSFTITVNEYVAYPNLKLKNYGGAAGAAYDLDERSIVLFIKDGADTDAPVMKTTKVESADRTTASIRVTFNEITHISYMYSPRGTKQPTVDQIINKTSIVNSVTQTFGTLTTNQYNYALISLSGLSAITRYEMFVTGIDQSNNVAAEVSVVPFATMRRHHPVRFRIYTSVVTDHRIVKLACSRTMAIPDDWVSYTGVDPTLLGRRVQSSYAYDFTLVVPDSDEHSSSPYDYARLLDARQDVLTHELPTLDVSRSITDTVTNFVGTNPEFITGPDVVSSGKDFARVTASLNTEGTICGIVLPYGSTAPVTEQIMRGQNAVNENVQDSHASCQTVLYQSIGELDFTDLANGITYVVYASGQNDVPGYPDIMEDYNIKSTNITIAEVEEYGVLILKQDSGLLLQVAAMLYFFLV